MDSTCDLYRKSLTEDEIRRVFDGMNPKVRAAWVSPTSDELSDRSCRYSVVLHVEIYEVAVQQIEAFIKRAFQQEAVGIEVVRPLARAFQLRPAKILKCSFRRRSSHFIVAVLDVSSRLRSPATKRSRYLSARKEYMGKRSMVAIAIKAPQRWGAFGQRSLTGTGGCHAQPSYAVDRTRHFDSCRGGAGRIPHEPRSCPVGCQRGLVVSGSIPPTLCPACVAALAAHFGASAVTPSPAGLRLTLPVAGTSTSVEIEFLVPGDHRDRYMPAVPVLTPREVAAITRCRIKTIYARAPEMASSFKVGGALRFHSEALMAIDLAEITKYRSRAAQTADRRMRASAGEVLRPGAHANGCTKNHYGSCKASKRPRPRQRTKPRRR
ncbi:MAG: hypothetical protein ACSLFQ_23795 [Thermoanaerobaculia bacterium]